MNIQNASFNWMSIFLLGIFILLLNQTTMSQEITTKDIIGVYSLPSSNPEGGQSVAVFPDSTFVSVYFGGLIKGHWEIEGSRVHFTTDVEPQVVLYGRKLSDLKDTMQLNFSGDFNQRAKVNLGVKTNSKLQNVFNEDANCKDYPYIYKTTEGLKEIKFAISGRLSDWEEEGEEDFNIFIFSVPDSYNDILAVNLPKEYTTENKFSVDYKNGGLCFSNNKPTSKRSIDSISEEDKSFYKKYSKKLLPDVLNYGNEVFPYIENPTKEMVQAFYIIQPTSLLKVKESEIKVIAGSLYTASCN